MLKDVNVIYETADFFGAAGMMPQSRIDTACESASAFHDTELFRLTNERHELRERLLANPCEFDAIEEKLRRNRIEIDALERSWQTSSLNRRYLMSRTERAKAGLPTEHYAVQEKRISAVAMPTSNTFLTDSESRPEPDGKTGGKILAGYAAKFNRLSSDLNGFREKIQVGAFNKVIKNCDCRCLFNHDASLLLGRTTSKTLYLFTDTIGLGFFADMIPGDTLSDSVASRVHRGDISGCSFSFVVGKDSWEFARKTDETDVRTILEIDQLFDVGPVTYPAYPCTVVGLREKLKKSNTGDYDFGLDDDDGDVLYETKLQAQRQLQIDARKREIERGCLHAERILNRCKAKLE